MEANKKKETEKRPNKGQQGIGIVGIAATAVLLIGAAAFFLAPQQNHTVAFVTLDEIEIDLKTKDEQAQPETKDFRKPTWANYQKKNNPSFFGIKVANILNFIGMKKRPEWSPSYFKNIVEKQLQQRIQAGYKTEHTLRVVPTEKARFVVFGDMIGAYHSLFRRLKKLASLNIIDQNLKLTSPDDYMVFMGDAVNRSPFTMEAFSLMLTLMDRNPGQIIYIKGSDEWKGYWHPYGFQEEFSLKAGHLASRDAFTTLIDAFFETLPLGLYVSVSPHTSNEFIRFSHYALTIPSTEKYKERVALLNDQYYSKALLENRVVKKEKIIPLKKWAGDVDPEPVNVRAIVKSFKKAKEYTPGKGLRLLLPEREATAWGFSFSPVVIGQILAGIYNEVFGVIESKPQIDDWTVTLYYRDIRKKEGFKTEQYNFVSGKKILD